MSQRDVAIVGIGCRFPGGANSPDAFWKLLENGVDAITDVPADRSELIRFYDPDPTAPGRLYLRRGGFMDRIDGWDAGFFGISPREAAHIDPQHRLLLEVVWEALEDAGIPPDRLVGSRTGVFVGISTHDYADLHSQPHQYDQIGMHSNTGVATSIAANRISYLYDFRGPSFTVDTACSSSVTALHLGCRSLRDGECDLALVGAAALHLSPALTIGFCKASMLSPDGECRAFDASANGYSRGEGTGMMVLKLLDKALADGDPIYAVVAGTAINQDGHTVGMTVPSAAAQAAGLRDALRQAGIAATDVDYVEAHGTGTPVGDPIEASAIAAVFSPGRTAPVPMGSVKTNIGHLESAAGIAGLIKTALAIKHRALPPSLHFTSPNPAIDDMIAGRIRVVTSLEPWPNGGGRATAAVNSFGFGGANAHAVLREGPAREAGNGKRDAGATLLALSARSADALVDTARAYVSFLNDTSVPFGDIAAAAATRRAQHDHRLAVAATTREEAVDALQGFVAGEARVGLASGRVSARKLAFVFSGMGPQWWGMGRQLRAESAVFREMIERCHEALRPISPWGLIDELSRGEADSRIAEPALAQVTNFAIQVAIVAQLEAWGVVPDAVVGHSAGEMAAAYVSGALSLEDAVCVSYHRSRLQENADRGRILAAGLSVSAAQEVIRGFENEVAIAAINSPMSCTLAGGSAALEQINERLQREQVFTRFLNFDRPYHCFKMDPIRDDLIASLSRIEPRPERLPLVSTVTASWMSGSATDAGYWWRNVRQPVRFADAMATLADAGFATFLEVSPHPVLGASIAECLAARGEKGAILATLRRKEDERGALLRATGALWALGRPVQWPAVVGERTTHVKLPGYPWQRERHWHEPASDNGDSNHVPSAGGPQRHPLLGRRLTIAHPTWESSCGGERLAYLEDHVIQGAVIMPGAAYAEMALAAAAELQGRPAVRDLEFKQALAMPKRADTIVQLATSPKGDRFEILSTTRGERSRWTLNASGTLGAPSNDVAPIDLDALRARLPREQSRDETYAALRRRGLEYGPSFRGIEQLWTGDGEALGRISASAATPGVSVDGMHTHPALVDAAFQCLIAAVESAAGNQTGLYLPVRIDEFVVHAPVGDTFWSHVRVLDGAEGTITGEITMIDDAGAVLATVRGFQCRQLANASAQATESIDDWLYEYRWERRPLAITSASEQGLAADASNIAGAVRPRAEALVAETEPLKEYADYVEPALERLTLAYIVRALQQLGWTMAVGERVETDVLLDSLGVVATRRELAKCLLGWLAGAGVFQRVGSVLKMVGVPDVPDPDDLLRTLAIEHPGFEVETELVVRSGSRLADVLNGKVDAVRDIFFANGGYEFMARVYREAAYFRYYYRGVAEVIAAALEAGPPDGRVRVLELGGGTAGTTGYVLEKLPADRTEYVFTDISSHFTRQAEARLAEFPHVQCRALDVERDFASQGLAERSFDIVLASDVLHGTASIATSLDNIHRVIAPGGALVLLEITRPKAWVDLVFGMTDGWWRFTDRDLRPDHPLLTADQWRQSLERAGFASFGMVAERYDGLAGQTVLVASKSGVETVASPSIDTSVLVFADRAGTGEALVRDLKRDGARCVVALADEHESRVDAAHFTLPPDDAGAVTRLLDTLAAEGTVPRALVYLWSLDAARPGDVPRDHILDTQTLVSRGGLAVSQALARRTETGSTELWFVTANAQDSHGGGADEPSVSQAPMWGLARSVMRERPDVRCRLIDIGLSASADEITGLAREVLRGEWEQELSLRGRERCVRRLHRTHLAKPQAERRPAAPGEAFRAHIGTPGALGTLCLRPVERRPPERGEVAIQIAAVSLNFREVMLSMGMLPAAATKRTFGGDLLGFDCAGTVVGVGEGVEGFAIGDEVVGGARGALASYVTTPVELVAHRPPSLSAEEAAGIPTVFVTAYHSLITLARLQRGERILIHAATGGVGLAAIQIAREIGAEIYATAGSAAKREYLASLGVEHIMDSRSLRFADEIMAQTRGAGVDVVLNSLSGDAIAKGISVLAPNGRFVEIGKRDIYQDSQIGLLAFQNNISFFAVDLDRLCGQRIGDVGKLMSEVTARLRDGTYHALPIEIFPISELEAAMRYLAQAKHIGKVVLTVNDPAAEIVHSSDNAPLCRRDGTYLVVGGLGAVGLALADWLASESAGALVLMGRRGAEGAAAEHVEQLRAKGVRVEIVRGDVSVADDVRGALEMIRASMPPLRGVFHAAMVIDDADVVDLDRDRMDKVLAPKVAGGWHLHEQTLTDPLDHFVLFASLVGLFGSPRQANYGAANAFLDALANHRHALGLPALAVDWGALGEAGYVARHKEVADYLDKQGYYGFSMAQTFDALGEIMRSGTHNVMAARIDWQRWVTYSPTAGTAPAIREFAARDRSAAAHTTGGGATPGSEARAAILAAEPARRRELVDAYLREKVAKVLGIAPSRLDEQAPLTGMGFDSLIAVELMTVLKMELGVELPVVKLLQGVSLAGLSALVIEQLPMSDAESATPRTEPAPVVEETVAAAEHAEVLRPVAEPQREDETAAPVEPVKPRPIAVPVAANGNGTPGNGNGNGNGPRNGRHIDYSSLDYSRWSPTQRAGRSAIVASMRVLTKLDAQGLEHLPASGPYLVACNHLHKMDVMVLFSMLRRRAVIYAAEYLRESALINWVLGDMGQAIYVKRGEADLEALEQGLTVLRSGGVLGIGPEGTRSKTGGLGKGRAGAAYIATRVDVPVVPVVAWGQEAAVSHWKRFRRPPVNVRIGPPLRFPQGDASVADLQQYTDQIMYALAALLPEEYRGVYRDQ